MSEIVHTIQVGKTVDGEPLVVAAEARVIALEKAMNETVKRIKALEKFVWAARERELMLVAEIAKDDPEGGAYLQKLMDRVLSYPMDDDKQ